MSELTLYAHQRCTCTTLCSQGERERIAHTAAVPNTTAARESSTTTEQGGALFRETFQYTGLASALDSSQAKTGARASPLCAPQAALLTCRPPYEEWSSQPACRRTALWLLLPAWLYPQPTLSAPTLLTSVLHVGSRSLLSCGRISEAQRCLCHRMLCTTSSSPKRRTSALSGAWDHRARQPKAVASTVLRRLPSGASLPP